MEPQSPPQDTPPATEQTPIQQVASPGQISSHINSDPRPPITELGHVPRHHKRVMMIVTIVVVVILASIAVGYYLGTSATKHTW